MPEENLSNVPTQKFEQHRLTFTIKRLEQLAVTGKTYYAYDIGQAGLCLRVSAGGTKSYVYYRKVDGRPERVTLGKMRALSIKDARGACKQFEGQRAAGRNPAKEKRIARKRDVRLDELMDFWTQSAKAKKLRSLPQEERLYKLHIRPTLGRKEARSISTSDVERLMVRMRSTPRMANRVYDLLRRIYKYAVIKKVVLETPCQGVTRYAENVRNRVLSSEEVKAFLLAVESENEPWASFFKLLLLLGTRRGAVAAMRWQDLDMDKGIWTLPEWASKNKKTLVIALVPQAVTVLKKLGKIDSTWVFPAKSKVGHIVEPAKAWNRIKEVSGLSDVRIHDIRRTVGTSLAISGASAHLIAKVLGHKSLQSAQAYVHLDATVARSALEGITEKWFK